MRQWLNDWDSVNFSPEERREEPEHFFYVFGLPASQLRALSRVYRRKATGPREEETAMQRAHDPKRSREIRRFIQGGFPWSELSDRQKQQREYQDLRMPGWLPTAIVANILPSGARRGGSGIRDEHLIRIEHSGPNTAKLILPPEFGTNSWDPRVAPVEIIDGQHRLWAFEGSEQVDGDFEVPVVAFHRLDVTWQAYLFYTINIKPKRINTSLAFDLYPLLRVQDWLEKSPSGPVIYRETRAQELTEVLWSHPESPWQGRINMLGEKGGGTVSQAAFIRSLVASYVKRGRGKPPGGLFWGATIHDDPSDIVGWNRPQQAAFLLLVWQLLEEAVAECNEPWARKLRDHQVTQQPQLDDNRHFDAAFAGSYSLLTTDQGVRGILNVTNDMCYVAADDLNLAEWAWEGEVEEDSISEGSVSEALKSLRRRKVNAYLRQLSDKLSEFDWRKFSFPGLDEEERRNQIAYRGSGGYKELRRRLIQLLMSADDPSIKETAAEVQRRLGY